MKKTFLLLSGLVLVLAGLAALTLSAYTNKIISRPMNSITSDSTRSSVYGFTVNSLDGTPVSLENYRGKFIVVLNVASECG